MSRIAPPQIDLIRDESGIRTADSIATMFQTLNAQDESLARLLANFNQKATLRRGSTLLINNATWETVEWDTSITDTGGFHDTTTNPDRVYFPQDGRYLILVNVLFQNNASGSLRQMAVELNSGGTQGAGTELVRDTRAPITAGRSTNLAASALYDFLAGDHIETWVYQNSGGSLALNIGSFTNTINIIRVSDLFGG